jgi:hypothetical protein
MRGRAGGSRMSRFSSASWLPKQFSIHSIEVKITCGSRHVWPFWAHPESLIHVLFRGLHLWFIVSLLLSDQSVDTGHGMRELAKETKICRPNPSQLDPNPRQNCHLCHRIDDSICFAIVSVELLAAHCHSKVHLVCLWSSALVREGVGDFIFMPFGSGLEHCDEFGYVIIRYLFLYRQLNRN